MPRQRAESSDSSIPGHDGPPEDGPVDHRIDAAVHDSHQPDADPQTSMTAVALPIVGSLVVALLVYEATNFREAARLSPLGIGIPLLGLLIWQSIKEVRRWKNHMSPDLNGGEIVQPQTDAVASTPLATGEADHEPGATVKAMYGWFIMLTALVIMGGFYVATVAFTFAFVRFQGRHTVKLALAHGVVSAVALYLILEVVFRLRVFAGVLA